MLQADRLAWALKDPTVPDSFILSPLAKGNFEHQPAKQPAVLRPRDIAQKHPALPSTCKEARDILKSAVYERHIQEALCA